MATKKEVAEHLDISEREVANLLNRLILPTAKPPVGLNIDRCRLAYISYLRGNGHGLNTEERLELDSERAKLAAQQAENTFLKNAKLRRELAPIVVIEWVLGKIGGQISAILGSVPLKVKRRVPRLNSTEIEVIRGEIVKAQNACAKITVDLDEFKP